MEISPSAVLAMWSGGVALGAAVVCYWSIVGPGYAWLSGATVLLFGVPAAITADGWFGWIGCALAATIVVLGRTPRSAAVGAFLAGVAFVALAAAGTPLVAAVSGAVFLGTVTTEMMLGHWYLVDPQLPRWALRQLALGGVGATFVDFGVLVAFGVFPWTGSDAAIGIGYIVLAASTALLMAAVVGALREDGYSGVMAATGLSYLALLTAIGTAVIGRMLASGPVL